MKASVFCGMLHAHHGGGENIENMTQLVSVHLTLLMNIHFYT